MTDEQIKQNAEEYAINSGYEPLPKGGWVDCTATDTYGISMDSYIEGAHSRDEEIRELEARLHLADNIINEQRILIDQLRNPWINTREQLPEAHQDVLIELNGSVIRNDYISIGDIDYMKTNPELFTRWMLTPKLNKL